MNSCIDWNGRKRKMNKYVDVDVELLGILVYRLNMILWRYSHFPIGVRGTNNTWYLFNKTFCAFGKFSFFLHFSRKFPSIHHPHPHPYPHPYSHQASFISSELNSMRGMNWNGITQLSSTREKIKFDSDNGSFLFLSSEFFSFMKWIEMSFFFGDFQC